MLRRLIVLCVLGPPLAILGLATQADASRPPDHKITICHATDSRTNPYVVITVDVASTRFAGHEDHDGPIFSPALPKHTKWGDIIPPTSNGGTRTVTPKNWDLGAAILHNGCHLPTPVTTTTASSTTTTAPTTTTVAPTTTVPAPTTTTTTVPVVTTTVPETTTTLAEATTTTTEGTAVTLGPPTRASRIPGAAVPTTPASSTNNLATTGAATAGLVLLGMTLLGAGAWLSRRQRG